MYWKLVKITPTIAREMLLANWGNRPITEAQLKKWTGIITRGEYLLTHQGLAFATTGRLLDGQHRLTVIANMPEGFSLEMWACYDMPEEVFKAIDTDNKPRSLSDVLHIDRKFADIGNYLARLVYGSVNVTPQVAAPYVHLIMGPAEALLATSKNSRKVWSSATVRAAACVKILQGQDYGYVLSVYKSLVDAEFDKMVPIAGAMFKLSLDHRLSTTNHGPLFVRSLRMFDIKNMGLTRFLAYGDETELANTKNWLKNVVQEHPTESVKIVRVQPLTPAAYHSHVN